MNGNLKQCNTHKNMTRQELKRMWFDLPHLATPKNIHIIKVSKLGENHYECKKVADDESGYSTFSSSYTTFEEALKFARKLMKDSPKFSIIIN